ncbi:helix-turn-helix transcriptional regulator [Pseudonocardia adelaidensis]|uniref:helix-turn-helix transcriptional regulator n=1 Tax=Pseudonocardia adelaidensis TaxID=648754 RepID=UPI0031E978B0
MRHLTRIASAEDVAVDDLRIVERTHAWTAPEHTPGHQLVFVRRGTFGLRLRRAETTVDPVRAFVGRAGDEQSIAHRPGREDACTVVSLGPRLADDVLPRRLPATLRTSGPVDMAHRALLARARQGADGFELSERVVRLADGLLRDPASAPARDGAPSHRRLAEAAREVLVADPAFDGLVRLARLLGVSRSHLSRVFRAETGETLTRYRRHLRVRAALDRLADGHRDLAGLAADLGFADHAHLTRAVRAEVGDPPSHVRRILADEHESSSRARRRRGRSTHDRSNLERPHIR